MVPKQLNNLNRGRKTSFDYEFWWWFLAGRLAILYILLVTIFFGVVCFPKNSIQFT